MHLNMYHKTNIYFNYEKYIYKLQIFAIHEIEAILACRQTHLYYAMAPLHRKHKKMMFLLYSTYESLFIQFWILKYLEKCLRIVKKAPP